MDKHLDPLDAWDDFWKHLMESQSGPIPNELIVANRTRNGLVLQPSGKVSELGWRRIKRLMDKYAPGRYELHRKEYFTKNIEQ